MSGSWSLSRAVVLAVGSELLTPYRSDTNSLWLTARLNELGIAVVHKAVVGDDRDALAAALRYAMQHGGLVITTGGLGPTDDDVTRETMALVLDRPLEEDPEVVERIRSRFRARGLEMPDINRRQALVPRGSVALPNARGTAPGLWVEHQGVVFVLLPGPPRELQPMFDDVAATRLRPATGGVRIFRRVLRIAGRTESHVEELAYPVYSQWRPPAPSIETTVLAALGQIELHLATRAEDGSVATRRLDDATAALVDVLGQDVVSTDGSPLEEVVGRLLRDRGQRVAVAESCTGGLVASRLTDVAGSSDYVHAGWVAYSNDAKVELLGVEPSLIRAHGAVSEPVADAMACGAMARAGVDYGLGVTGIAGPGGGTTDKPVGTVCVALAGAAGTRVRTLRFPGERAQVKFQSSQAALDMLRRALLRAG